MNCSIIMQTLPYYECYARTMSSACAFQTRVHLHYETPVIIMDFLKTTYVEQSLSEEKIGKYDDMQASTVSVISFCHG